MSPREVQMAIRAYGRRLVDALELHVTGAFHTVRFDRQKRPDLARTIESMRGARGAGRRPPTMAEDIRRFQRFFRGIRGKGN